MNLTGLVHREFGEGLTEEELASAVGVPVWTIANILAGKLPHDPAVWERFARYFRMDADFLRTGGPLHSEGLFQLTPNDPVGRIRQVPLLKWHQIDQMVTGKEPPHVIHAEAMLETDVPGRRTFAVRVKDDSMQSLFSEGEIIFVNPDLPAEPGHYVMVKSADGGRERAHFRQIKKIGEQLTLHPLNRRYEDLPVTELHRIVGRVVRLRKNL